MNVHVEHERTLRDVQFAAEEPIRIAKDLSRALWHLGTSDAVLPGCNQGMFAALGWALDDELRKIEALVYGKTVEEIVAGEEEMG